CGSRASLRRGGRCGEVHDRRRHPPVSRGGRLHRDLRAGAERSSRLRRVPGGAGDRFDVAQPGQHRGRGAPGGRVGGPLSELVLTGDMLVTLAITLGAVILFVLDRFPIEVVGLMVMVALIVTGVVTPAEGVSGFASEALITIAAMFVLSAALVRTGGVDALGRWISRMAGSSDLRLLIVSLAVV